MKAHAVVRIEPTTVATPWGGRLNVHAIISVKSGKVLGTYVDPKNAQRRADTEGWEVKPPAKPGQG